MPNFGDLADAAAQIELAVAAESAGWDGFFVWDHIVVADGMPVADPWVVIGAQAAATTRIALGPMVTPLPRRRPWVVARQSTTVDRLSAGRLVLGVGIGFPPREEFATFDETTDDRERADMLDEGLEVLEGMWSGRRFRYDGVHYRVRETSFRPTPVSPQGIPIWVGGMWPNPRPLQRSARFDGYFPVKMDMTAWTPGEVASIAERVRHHRGGLGDFDVVVGGGFDPGSVRDLESAGATWYCAGPAGGEGVEELREAIGSGPP